nr:dihydrofolate reductase family protein [Streptomyces afghaniensis]
MSWVMPYAVSDVARVHLTSLWEPATTALLGRVNAEGFLGFWPTVIGMEGADPREESFAKWLVDTDKVVLSSTLDKATWERTTIVDKSAAEVVGDLKATEGGDILVLSSASVIKALLAADKVDRLALTIFPGLPRRRAPPLRRRSARGAVDARQPGRGRARTAGRRLRPGPLKPAGQHS